MLVYVQENKSRVCSPMVLSLASFSLASFHRALHFVENKGEIPTIIWVMVASVENKLDQVN